MKDVYEEVDELMGKMRVGMHKIKPCTRKYAFELPGIPKEGEYLKLLYPYSSMFTPHLHLTLLTFQNLNFNMTTTPGLHFLTFLARIHPSSSNLSSGRTLWVLVG